MFQRKKWWEVVKTEAETRLFQILSRSEKFKWRSIVSVSKELDIDDPEELEELISVFIKNRMILIRKTDKGVYLGYWENVETDGEVCKCKCHDFGVEEDEFDPNMI